MVYVTAIALLLIFCGPAHAYIDPGSGSYMLQMSIAGLLAIVFSIKLFWQRLKASIANSVRSHVRTDTRDHR